MAESEDVILLNSTFASTANEDLHGEFFTHGHT